MKEGKERINKVGFFLDSGAFSAWTQNSRVDIEAYADFALANLDVVEAIANLDVIPGNPNQAPTPLEVERSAEKGWENYEYLLSRGIPKDKLIHTFHIGEDFKWLERMVEEMPYIGFGGFAKGRSMSEKIAWLDECMNYVTDDQGMPLVKFHGFAATAYDLIWRYPWYSVDSSSWMVYGTRGAIILPRFKKGKWDYHGPLYMIKVSTRSPQRKEAGNHIDTLSPKEREMVIAYIESKGYKLGRSSYKTVGADYELAENEIWMESNPVDKSTRREVEVIEEDGVCNRYYLRHEINWMYYLDLQAHLPAWPRPFKKKTAIPRMI